MYINLKMQIWRMGLRQNRLAQMVGIDESLLSRIVNGYRAPRGKIRTRLAEVLKSDESWLFAPAEAASAAAQASQKGNAHISKPSQEERE